MTTIREIPELLAMLNEAWRSNNDGHELDYNGYLKDGAWGIAECVAAAATFYKRKIICYHSNVDQFYDTPSTYEPWTTHSRSMAETQPPLHLCSWGNHFGSVTTI